MMNKLDINNHLVKAIDNNNLEYFLQYFKLSEWKDSITKIENYAGVSEYNPIVHYNDCDVFKYSLHKNSDKIFNYLLPLVDTNKHGDNYGWPLLAMAIKNNRYDYAYSILNHSSFNPYPIYHTNQFGFIETKNNTQIHINFLFEYVNKFSKYDLNDEFYIGIFTHLICFNEETFIRFQQIYQKKFNKPNFNLFSLFENNWNTLGQEVFYNYFRPFILDKLSDNQFKELFLSIQNENIIFVKLFQDEKLSQKCLDYLIKFPDLLQSNIYNNPVVFSYLPLNSLIFLEKNNLDIWNTDNKDKYSVIEYVLDNQNLLEKKTNYYINKFPQKILTKLKNLDRKSNIQKYCQKLLFSQ